MAMTETQSPSSEASHEDRKDVAEDGHSKPHAAKDRECQFCHQKFTSSSLGRHLDQFLHKKKPDGVHNVEEIRFIRRGITRRTARNSSKHDHDEGRTGNASPAPASQNPTGPVTDNLNNLLPNGLGMKFNSMNWHSTGVINNVTEILTAPMPTTSPVGAVPGTKRSFSTFSGADHPMIKPNGGDNEKDTTIRALELSLREVLDSVHAATARVAPRHSPFTFDLQSQTFPSLVLELLPTPPTLFSANPFATSTSAPIDPPDASHLPLLRLNLETQIQNWKWNALRHAQSQTFPTAHSTNIGEEADYLTHTASQYEEFSLKHLTAAFTSWSTLSPSEKQHQWTLELTRALATQSQKTKDLTDRLDTVTAEATRLQSQLEQLSRCQWPREMALWPPEPVRFTRMAADDIRGMDRDRDACGESDESINNRGAARAAREVAERWDYDRLVAKWRRRVREDRTRRTGMGTFAAGAAAGPTSAVSSSSMGTVAAGGGSNGSSRIVELQREGAHGDQEHDGDVRSATPPALQMQNGSHGLGNEVAAVEGRRKGSLRQQQQQHLVTSSADKDDRTREREMMQGR